MKAFILVTVLCGVQWADEPIAWAVGTPTFEPALSEKPAEPATETGLVVVSPSFVCPPCVALKSRLMSAGITYSARIDDNAGPWPRVYAGMYELTPDVVTAIAGTVAKVKQKTKVKMRSGAYVAPMAVHSVETHESHSMSHSSHSMSMVHGKRRGLLGRLFGRRGMKMKHKAHSSVSASMGGG